jgi:CheY-like chemotaxis protein
VDARILLVEDDPSIREVTAIGLRNAGFTVESAADGREGLDRFAAEPFDLILMDMQMPVMDGYEAVRALRARGVATPIIAITANAMAGDRERCIAAGCSEYETKPIKAGQLVEKIARLA